MGTSVYYYPTTHDLTCFVHSKKIFQQPFPPLIAGHLLVEQEKQHSLNHHNHINILSTITNPSIVFMHPPKIKYQCIHIHAFHQCNPHQQQSLPISITNPMVPQNQIPLLHQTQSNLIWYDCT